MISESRMASKLLKHCCLVFDACGELFYQSHQGAVTYFLFRIRPGNL
jgi:hypothetical protein